MNIELVIAAYDRDINWVKKLNDDIKVTIYRKGDLGKSEFEEVKIENNVGRDVHTFFNHIVNNYDNLSDYTFFVQDYPFDHWGNLIDVLNNNTFKEDCSLLIGDIENGYYGFHNNTFGSAWNMYTSRFVGNGNIISCYPNGYPQDTVNGVDVNKYWSILFDDIHQEIYEFMPGGHFGAHKDIIKIRTKDFYCKVVDILENDTRSPWNIERLECYFFNKNYKSKI